MISNESPSSAVNSCNNVPIVSSSFKFKNIPENMIVPSVINTLFPSFSSDEEVKKMTFIKPIRQNKNKVVNEKISVKVRNHVMGKYGNQLIDTGKARYTDENGFEVQKYHITISGNSGEVRSLAIDLMMALVQNKKIRHSKICTVLKNVEEVITLPPTVEDTSRTTCTTTKISRNVLSFDFAQFGKQLVISGMNIESV